MRQLNCSFMTALKTGFLSPLLQRVIEDKDLDLQIRNDYINIYYKGSSLLKLSEEPGGRFCSAIHPKFIGNLSIPHMVDEDWVRSFLRLMPSLKENVRRYGDSSVELEYSQLIIRANNLEMRNNSEYFIVDREYASGDAGRFDLTGIFWDGSKKRTQGQTVPLAFFEVKFALNNDIQHIHAQISRYYEAVKAGAAYLAEETRVLLHQKLDLGLIKQPPDRVEALRTLKISSCVEDYHFILVLVDYNPYSTLLNLDAIRELEFADQIRIFRCGFGVWQQYLSAVTPLETAFR